MPHKIEVELMPLGRKLTLDRGSTLQSALFSEGVEFPCGGKGRCKGCRVKVLEGFIAASEDDARLLSRADIEGGWRLACRARAEGNLKLELAQWETSILADESALLFCPRPGLGIAVDLGTTTLVAQLLDLETGHVLGVQTALNSQAEFGADIMSRIEHALSGKGQALLERCIRKQIWDLIGTLLDGVGDRACDLKDVVIVGNTAMHNLFCGITVAPLSSYPFEPAEDGLRVFQAEQLGWEWESARGMRSFEVRFLPCLGGFVGSDILAGVLATRLLESEALVGLIDMGTNGEIVIGNRRGMLCASTAAGPAFEGARISMGMRAATGAISEVLLRDGNFHCRVLGEVEPRGICGSGLVDAIAAGLDNGAIEPSGRLASGPSMQLAGKVTLSQKDIRELQLAKAAIAAGVDLLLQKIGAAPKELSKVYLAGAFGNYINRASARRIGLLNFEIDQLEPAGNTALKGAKLALSSFEDGCDYATLRKEIRHVSLKADEHFQEAFVEQMRFPS
jgi:uncharacterized 2Fe-2S/4Fe-4S cluster protein (DUF4445 family)